MESTATAPRSVETREHSPAVTSHDVLEMRNEQKRMLAESAPREGYANQSAYAESQRTTYESFDEQIDRKLEAKGITKDHPKYAEYKQLLRDFSVDKYSDEQWDGMNDHPGGNQDVRTRVHDIDPPVEPAEAKQSAASTTETQAETTNTSTTQTGTIVSNEAAARAAEQYEESEIARVLAMSREEYAAVLAKRQRRLFGKPKGTNGSYSDTENNYWAAVTEYGRERDALHGTHNPDRTEAGRNLAMAMTYLEEQSHLRSRVDELTANRKLQKFEQKVGRWFLYNKDGTELSGGKKFVRGAVAGLGIGLTAGLLAPAVGLAAGVGAAGVGAYRFGRMHAIQEVRQGHGISTELDETTKAHINEGQGDINHVENVLRDKMEADMKAEQKKRLKAVGAGALGVVLGSTVGAAVHAVDWQGSIRTGDLRFDGMGLGLPNINWPNGFNEGIIVGDVNQDGVPDAKGRELNPDLNVDNLSDRLENRAENLEDRVRDLNEQLNDNYDKIDGYTAHLADQVRTGEVPNYNLGDFHDGILRADGDIDSNAELRERINALEDSIANREATLQRTDNIVDRLETRLDGAHGIVGDGDLGEDHQRNYEGGADHNNGTGTDHGHDHSGDDTAGHGETGNNGGIESNWDGTAANHITMGEGWYQTFQEMGVPAHQRDELLRIVGPQLVEQGIAYPDASIGGYGIARPGDMPNNSLQTIMQAAQNNGIGIKRF